MVGDTRAKQFVRRIEQNGWGRMTTARIAPYQNEPWGFDNGAYSAWANNEPFPTKQFEARIAAMNKSTVKPYMAVVPDIVAAGMRSLTFSQRWREKLGDDPFWYLAVQDGMTVRSVAKVLEGGGYSGLFLGGTDAFKQTALDWADLAHALGLKFHYGRAGTARKIRFATASDCDSFDSAFPLWTQTRFAQFEKLLGQGDPERFMFPKVAEALHE
jgi:hypothetical protein